jgi:hypothetical protein
MSSADERKPLARCGRVRLPGGGTIETPILIPSFSSKGFLVDNRGESEVRNLLEFASEWLTDSMLVSAYDIKHGHLPDPTSWTRAAELTIVDSGGYEARIDHDLSTSVHVPHAPKVWDAGMLHEVLASWPERFTASFVSFDHPSEHHAFEQQVERACASLERYPSQLHTILLKPETDSQKTLGTTLKHACAGADQLGNFDFVGVAEKELGASMLDRMHEIAKLRLAMDDASVAAPIHVFGALDPLSSALYFLAGAEVFDGLTWLRYAFNDGVCVYQANYGVLAIGPETRDDRVRAQALTANVHYLSDLRLQMRRFTLERDFRKFKHHREQLENAFDSLRAKLKGRI